MTKNQKNIHASNGRPAHGSTAMVTHLQADVDGNNAEILELLSWVM